MAISIPAKIYSLLVAGLSFSLIGTILFFATGYIFEPRLKTSISTTKMKDDEWEAPVLIYISTLFAVIVPLFSTLTFAFDQARIPVILSFLILSAIVYQIYGVDHFFELFPESPTSEKESSASTNNFQQNMQEKPEIISIRNSSDASIQSFYKVVSVDCHGAVEQNFQNEAVRNLQQAIKTDFQEKIRYDFKTAISKRLADQGDSPHTLVIITASGGGIHAAGWTAQVLTGLQKLLGEEFTKAIGFISSVSGGSVGTMHFLDQCNQRGYPDSDRLIQIIKNTVRDGLDAVGWGTVHKDYWRFVMLPWVINKNEDRGTILEKDWQKPMIKPTRTLSSWRHQIMQGEIPIPVFNTTLVEDGRRLLLSPMAFASSENEQKIDSNLLYQKGGKKYDMKVVTAARLSATFPYVSPSPRNPDFGFKRNYHMIDGGYFDNSGVVTAIEWLEDNFEILIDELKIERLVFIEIEAGEVKPPPAEVSGGGGWSNTLFAPIKTLLTVRDASLTLRNQQSIDLLVDHYRSELDKNNLDKSEQGSNVQYLRIDFPRRSKFRFEKPDSEGIKNGKEYTQPLSWKLTASQKYVLEEAWRGIIPDHSDPYPALVNLQRLWHEKWGFPKPEINQK
jgi:hypothetical protein